MSLCLLVFFIVTARRPDFTYSEPAASLNVSRARRNSCGASVREKMTEVHRP